VVNTRAIELATRDYAEPARSAFQLGVIAVKSRRIYCVAIKVTKRRAVSHTLLQMVPPLSSTGSAFSSVTTLVDALSTAESTNARRRAINKTPNQHTVPGLRTLCLTAPVGKLLYQRYQRRSGRPARIGYQIVPKLALRHLVVAINARSLAIKANAYPV
jgi:hypothetical protein